jgi:hypothetical protein
VQTTFFMRPWRFSEPSTETTVNALMVSVPSSSPCD